MSGLSRSLLAVVSFALSIIFVWPTLSLYFIVALVMYHKYVSAFFMLVFAWNIAKLVESKYQEYLEKQNEH